MAVTLNRRAFEHAKGLSTAEDLYSTSEMHGASTSRRHSKRTNSFASTVLPNTANGIWNQ